VNGRPYNNKIVCFGQEVTYGLDPKGSKHKPGWRKGVWFAKAGANHDGLATASGTITRTKSSTRTAVTWSADGILNLVIGPWDTTGYSQSKVKQNPALVYLPDRSLMKKMKQSRVSQIQTMSVNKNKFKKQFNPTHMGP
jgi:hypothetical protein